MNVRLSWQRDLTVAISGHGCVSVRGTDAPRGLRTAGSGSPLPLSSCRGNGPVSVQSGGGDDPVTLEVRSLLLFFLPLFLQLSSHSWCHHDEDNETKAVRLLSFLLAASFTAPLQPKVCFTWLVEAENTSVQVHKIKPCLLGELQADA